MPRPLSSAIHGEKPNKVLHADMLDMSTAEGSELKHYSLIKGYISSYTWLHPCEWADRDAVMVAVSRWRPSIGCVHWLVTDERSYFVESLVNKLPKGACIRHLFTAAYCPWANGTMERVSRELFRTRMPYLGGGYR